MKKMSPFLIERKEAEGGESPFSEEKATKQPALLPQTYIAPQSDQYRSQGRAILLGGRSNIALNASYKRNVRLPKGKGEADEEKETEP